MEDFYRGIYTRFIECRALCPKDGLAVELGSGAGFLREYDPAFIATDIISYPDLDVVLDATQMPFGNNQVSMFAMINTFHHIPDVARFLREVERCLKPGGRLLMTDQHHGILSSFILKHLHHEPYRPESDEWSFVSSGPLSGANGALPHIVFQRDRQRLALEVPRLKLNYYRPHTPLQYWIAGGLKRWSMWPFRRPGAVHFLDHSLLRLSENFGSFVDIEMTRI